MGRPRAITPEIEKEILYRIENGESLLQICKDPQMPGRNTVNDHIFADKIFSGKYNHARERQAEYLFEEMHEIARGKKEDDFFLDEKGCNRPNAVSVNRDRLRFDETRYHLLTMHGHRFNQEKFGQLKKIEGLSGTWEERAEQVMMKAAAGEISAQLAEKYINSLMNIAKLAELTDLKQRVELLEQRFK